MTISGGEHDGPGWIPDGNTFGARLALVRQRMAWGNVKEAAVACGLPPESWRTWERDGVQPRNIVDIAAQIADRTGCDYGWLLAGQRLGDREGRLIASGGSTGSTHRRVNAGSPRAAETTRPPGRTNHHGPHDATRRPARIAHAHNH